MIETLLKNIISKDEFRLDIKEPRYMFNNYPVPRVTEILSKMISEDYLMYWANSLGFKRKSYKKELQAAANIGTEGHNAIENYLKDGTIIKNNVLNSFLIWWDGINKNCTTKIIGIEGKLSCPWFGGTYDMIVEIDGKSYLVDFKTSNHISYKYFLQLAAYIYMLDIKIDGCIILQLDKYEESFEEYFIDFSISEHAEFMAQCQQTYLSLAFSYYNIFRTQYMYNQLF